MSEKSHKLSQPIEVEMVTDWADPGFFTSQSRTRNFFRLLKNLVKSIDGQKNIPTIAGSMLLLVSIGIGTAAYNTSSNILFMTLALLLSSLILSGFMAWTNFRDTRWRLLLEPHFRAGEVTPVRVEITNAKRLIPSYSLVFNLHAGLSDESVRLFMHERLDAGSSVKLDWIYEPPRRGLEVIAITGLESLFPFGFLRKIIPGDSRKEVAVWPQKIDYHLGPMEEGHKARQTGEALKRRGSGSELINLRNYRHGDSVKTVHWKASARMRKLMVRDTSDENRDSLLIVIETPANIWNDDNKFELLCSFAGSLAEDLYMENRLWGIAINDEPLFPIKRLHDLHYFLGKLARLERVDHFRPRDTQTEITQIRFCPGSGNRVYAMTEGSQVGYA